MSHRMHAKEFVVGAVVGSVLGSIAALLAAPKSGKKLREGICDAYCNFSEKTRDIAKKGRSFANKMGYRGNGNSFADRARSTMNGVKKNIQNWKEEFDEEGEGTRDLLVGGIAGGVLGAVVGLLLAPKPGEELIQDIVDRYEDVNDKAHEYTKRGRKFAKAASSKANKWLDFARDVVGELAEDAEDVREDLIDKAKDLVHNERVNDIIDWAALGYRVWQGVKSKR